MPVTRDVVVAILVFGLGYSAQAKQPDFFGIAIRMKFADMAKKFGDRMACKHSESMGGPGQDNTWRECELKEIDPIVEGMTVRFSKAWGDRAYDISVNLKRGKDNMPILRHKEISKKLLAKFGGAFKETRGEFGIWNRRSWQWKVGGSTVTYTFFIDDDGPAVAQEIEISSDEYDKWLRAQENAPSEQESADRLSRTRL